MRRHPRSWCGWDGVWTTWSRCPQRHAARSARCSARSRSSPEQRHVGWPTDYFQTVARLLKGRRSRRSFGRGFDAAARRRLALRLAVLVGYAVAAAVVLAPVAAEQAVERVRFTDRLGTLPVEASLAHNGVSTLDTGMLGKVYWARTGVAGFGAYVRA